MTYSFPKLVIEEHEGFYVVRDDLLEGGSKRRFVDRLIREEIKKVAKALKKASALHKKQSKVIEKHIKEMKSYGKKKRS